MARDANTLAHADRRSSQDPHPSEQETGLTSANRPTSSNAARGSTSSPRSIGYKGVSTHRYAHIPASKFFNGLGYVSTCRQVCQHRYVSTGMSA
jgi:hypothetical protein